MTEQRAGQLAFAKGMASTAWAFAKDWTNIRTMGICERLGQYCMCFYEGFGQYGMGVREVPGQPAMGVCEGPEGWAMPYLTAWAFAAADQWDALLFVALARAVERRPGKFSP